MWLWFAAVTKTSSPALSPPSTALSAYRPPLSLPDKHHLTQAPWPAAAPTAASTCCPTADGPHVSTPARPCHDLTLPCHRNISSEPISGSFGRRRNGVLPAILLPEAAAAVCAVSPGAGRHRCPGPRQSRDSVGTEKHVRAAGNRAEVIGAWMDSIPLDAISL